MGIGPAKSRAATGVIALRRVPAAAAVVGGLAWIPVRLAVSGSWGEAVAGLSYVEWDRLMVIPLILLLAAIPSLRAMARWRPARVSAGDRPGAHRPGLGGDRRARPAEPGDELGVAQRDTRAVL